jgi:predicted  nucleic acid-binding Zn-ribbon protein
MHDILDMYKGAEELGLDGAGGEAVVDAVEDVVKTEIAEVTVAIEEQSTAVEQLVAKVDDLEEAVEEATEVVEGMESLINSGNFNPLAFAQLYNRGVKLGNKLGANIQGDRMGAESITDASTAQMYARQGMESIMDSIKEYGKKAVEFIKHIFNTVINFFVSIFDKATGLERRCDQLKKRLEDSTKLKETVKLGGWNVYVDYAKGGLGSAKTAGFEATQGAIAKLTELGKNVTGISLEDFKSAYSGLISAIKTDAKAAGKYNEKKAGTHDVLIGVMNGIRIQVSYIDSEIKTMAEAAAAARSLKMVVMKDPEAKKLTSGEVKAKADKSALLKAISEVRGTGAFIRNTKVAKAFSAAERDRVVGSLNSIKAGDADKSAEVNGQVNLVKAVYSSTSTMATNVTKVAINTAGAVLDCVAAHL